MYVYRGLQGFVAELLAPLGVEDATPVLRGDKQGVINAVLGNGGHSYLTLTAPASFEIVRVTASYNTVVFDRGQDGTVAQPFPIGSCLQFVMVGAAVTDLSNQADACPPDCIEATILRGATAPSGTVGVPYEHRIVISGTPPFRLGQVLAPEWMDVFLDAGEIRLSGIPAAPGTYDVSVPLRSCGNLLPFFQTCINIASSPG